MKNRRAATLLTLFSAIVVLAVTSSPAVAETSHPGVGPIRPSYSGYFPARLRFKVSSAFNLALDHLTQNQSCRDLFGPYGSNGLSAMGSSSFEAARSAADLTVCSERSAAAFTAIGGSQTHLCPRLFGHLTVQRAAVILIHESLHQAGMTEWPIDPDGLQSSEINILIRNRCGL